MSFVLWIVRRPVAALASEAGAHAAGLGMREALQPRAMAWRLSQVTQTLAAEQDEQLLADAIAEHAAALLPGTHATLLLPQRRGRLATVAGTSSLGREADRLQVELGEGPALEVRSGGPAVGSDGDELASRWAQWGRRVSDLGLCSVHAAPVRAGNSLTARLCWYGSRPTLFRSPDDRLLTTLFAVHAGHAYAAVRLAEGLRAAAHSRHGIGLAQGMLMERYGLTVDRSYELLRRISTETNTKLVEVARQVVSSGGDVGGRSSGGATPGTDGRRTSGPA